jgi:mannosyl-3-phosphoglycerate phosphatase
VGRLPDFLEQNTGRTGCAGEPKTCTVRTGPAMRSNIPLVVFSDLDETLLQPSAPGIDEASRLALERVRQERIPIVMCSSRTRAELELMQEDLGIADPFICESGAAIFVPRGYFSFDVPNARDVAGYKAVEFGRPYEEVVTALKQAAGRLGADVIGFSDMSVEEVARDCNLPLLQARLAKLREYSELFRIPDTDPTGNLRLLRSLRHAGLDCVCRGRFYHLGMVRRETAALFLSRLYRRAYGPLLTTVGFADSSPALPMLHGMDLPLVLQREITAGTSNLMASARSARLTLADSLPAFADIVLDIVRAARDRSQSCV